MHVLGPMGLRDSDNNSDYWDWSEDPDLGGADVCSRVMQMREVVEMGEGENVGAAKKGARAAVSHWVLA